VLTISIAADVMKIYFYQSFFEGFFQEAVIERGLKHSGKERKNIKPDHSLLQTFKQSDNHPAIFYVYFPDYVSYRRQKNFFFFAGAYINVVTTRG
jgi:hypothetical protein